MLLGYGCKVWKLSWAQENTKDPSWIVTRSLVDNPWDVAVTDKIPVEGLYVVPDSGWIAGLPDFWIPEVALINLCVLNPTGAPVITAGLPVCPVSVTATDTETIPLYPDPKLKSGKNGVTVPPPI